MWVKLNITQAKEKIEIYRSNKKKKKKKKTTNNNTKKLRRKPSSVKGKTTRQIWSIHYNKIEITTLKLCPKPEFTINWENTIILLGINTTSPQNPIIRSSTMNTSTLYGSNTQITILEKTPIYQVCLEQKKNHIYFFPSMLHKAPFFFLQSASELCFPIQSLSISLYVSVKPHASMLYIKALLPTLFLM